jgi:hypothetical protein
VFVALFDIFFITISSALPEFSLLMPPVFIAIPLIPTEDSDGNVPSSSAKWENMRRPEIERISSKTM